MTEGIASNTEPNDPTAPAERTEPGPGAAPQPAAPSAAAPSAAAPSAAPRYVSQPRPAGSPAWAPTPAVFESEMEAVPARRGSRLGGTMLLGWTAVMVLGVTYAVFWYVRQEAGLAIASATTDARVTAPGEMADVEVSPNLIDPRLRNAPRALPVQRDPFGRGRGAPGQPARDAYAPFAPAVYPTEQLIEQEVKGLSAFTEDAGLQMLRARMLNPQRSGPLTHQPVDFGAHGDFQSVLTWVSDLHQSRPGWVVGWMQLTPLPGTGGARSSARVNASVSLWAYADAGSNASGKGGMPTYPRMDLSGALRELAAATGGKGGAVKYLELHLGPDTAPMRGPSDTPKIKGWVTGLAPTLHEVNDLAVRLARSDLLSDVSLVDDGSASARRLGAHKFRVEFRANPLAKPSQAAASVPDPFRPASGEGVARANPHGGAAGEDPFSPSAADIASQLRLQAVVGKACMINNRSYRVGDVVDGFTIVQITEHGVVVTSGTTRAELKLGKK